MLGMLAPFDHVRFMGITGTNTFAGYWGDPGHHYLEWDTNRCFPTDAQWPQGNQVREGCWGMPWETVVSLAQQSKKGLWINMPVSATIAYPVNTSTYVYKWAQLFKDGNAATGGKGVPDGTVIYIEHSNEVRAANVRGRGGERGAGIAEMQILSLFPAPLPLPRPIPWPFLHRTPRSPQVWNFGFSQYSWNYHMAVDECNITTHPKVGKRHSWW